MKKEMILLTGFRLIGILQILNKKPSTRQEIMSWFNEEFKIPPFSMETMKLDINTLLKLGYKIKKHRKNGQNYLSLDEKISMIRLGEEDILFFLAAKNFALEVLDYKKIFEMKNFYEQLSFFVKEEYKRYFLDFKGLNVVDKKILSDLESVIEEKGVCKILYDSPSKNKRQIIIEPIKILFKNNKLYLKCLTNEYTKSVSFRVDNILNVDREELLPRFKKNKTKITRYAVNGKYFDNLFLEKGENIVQSNNKEVLIETEEENEFFIMQRIISLQKNCTKIEDKRLKNKIINNLKEILELYR